MLEITQTINVCVHTTNVFILKHETAIDVKKKTFKYLIMQLNCICNCITVY